MNFLKTSKLKSDKRIQAWDFVNSIEGPSILITAGVHGGENTPVEVALKVIECLKKYKIKGNVTIIPIVNPDGYLKGTRLNPVDKKNINASGNVNGKSSSEDTVSDDIANELLKISRKYDYVIDLHSGSINRYLPHVYFCSLEHKELARYFGLNFAIYHRTTNNHIQAGYSHRNNIPIFVRACNTKTTTFGLELGAGHVVYKEDVEIGVRCIFSFLNKVGLLSVNKVLRKTSLRQVFEKARDDIMTVIRAPYAGVIHYTKNLGELFHSDEVIAYIIDSATFQRKPIYSPIDGRIVLQRIQSNLSAEEINCAVVARLIPCDNKLT